MRQVALLSPSRTTADSNRSDALPELAILYIQAVEQLTDFFEQLSVFIHRAVRLALVLRHLGILAIAHDEMLFANGPAWIMFAFARWAYRE